MTLGGLTCPLPVFWGYYEYPTVARCRYADKRLAFTEIYLTSVVPPEELYPYAGREEFEQLKRRITYVVYHYRNDTCEGEGRF